jgi:glucose/mannose-6-phosphate isomerase
MLDNLKLIRERDANDALGVAEKQWRQLQHIYDVDVSSAHNVQNIVLAGMGGSAWPALYIKSWPGTTVPFEIVSSYELPMYVNENTLVIVSSYSGNTEEALAMFSAAESRRAQVVVFTSGGIIGELAREKRRPLFRIPAGIQPRMSSFYYLAAFVQLLEPLGLIPPGSSQELRSAGDWLRPRIAPWTPTVATADNPAKQLALELTGRSVVVYSGPRLFPAANKWKICLNENSKTIAWVNQYPEFNHNEFIGWSNPAVDKPYVVVEIRSNVEDERVQRRFLISENLLSDMRPEPHVIEPVGQTILQQLIWTSNFGDFTSLYLALLYGIDPTPVDLVEKLKAALKQ